MKLRAFALLLAALANTFLTACSLDPTHVQDPRTVLGVGPRVPDVIKSVRCEVITFLVENKLRSQLWRDLAPKLILEDKSDQNAFLAHVDYLRKIPFLNIDSTQFAAVSVDLKNVNTLNLSLGYDWKKTAISPGKLLSNDYHFGPSYGDTQTFELVQPFALPQNSDLGPQNDYRLPGSPPTQKAARYSTAYYRHPVSDEPFYCYKSLFGNPSSTLTEVMDDIQHLVTNEYPAENYKNFERIYVGSGGPTLAAWLQDVSADLAANERTIFPNVEVLYPGQLQYVFTLDVKPGLDLKYTLIAGLSNPLIPDVSASIEHSSSFSIYLNTPDAKIALGAKQGTTCNKSVPGAKCKDM